MEGKLTSFEIEAVGKWSGIKVWNESEHPRGAGGRFGQGGGGKKPEKFNREVAIKDKSSAAYGGRLPIGNELKSIHHITNTRTAVKILSSKEGFKSSYQIDPQFAQDSYGEDSDAGNFVYVGLNKEAAGLAAVSSGVRFVLNGNPYKDRAIVQPDQEGGIAMFYGSIPRDSIMTVIVDEPESKEGKAVMDAWDKYKKEIARASR